MNCWKAKRLKKKPKTTVECQLCGKRLGYITATHFTKCHLGWDSVRYQKTFPDSPMRVHSSDTKDQMSVTRINNWKDPEKRRIMTDQLIGRKFSEEGCKSIGKSRIGKKINRIKSVWNKGKKMSSEYCQTMSIAAAKRKPTVKGYISAKTGKKITYRSYWELCYYLHLEYRNDVVAYAVESFFIEYEDLQGKTRRYIPDVLIWFDNGVILLVEIKASWALEKQDTLIKIAAGKAYARSHGWSFKVVTEKQFNFDRMLISSLADHFDNNINDQKVQRLVAEASQADNATTSARLLVNNQDEDIVRHSEETRRSGIKSPE